MTAATPPCPLERASGGRFRLTPGRPPIGRGATSVVRHCTDLSPGAGAGARWVAKELQLRHAPDWKTWELFKRGAEVLRTLDHPGIPRFRELVEDTPESTTDAPARLWLIEAHVPGVSLRELLRSGRRFSASDVATVGVALASILNYLHLQSPPVVHRDVKPSNVLLRTDGGVSLIDFGAVQHALRHGTLGGSTVVGTFGYMPPEQYMGRAEPASDQYGLGATLVTLLTGKDPNELPVRDMRLTWEDHAGPSPLDSALRRLLDPRAEGRFPTVGDARRALEQALAAVTGGLPFDVSEDGEAPPTGGGDDELTRAVAALEAMPDPPGARRKPSDLRCPACGGTCHVVALEREGVELDRCGDCGGLWLDRGELDALVDAVRPVTPGASLADIRREVRAMALHDVGAVVYRRCPRCDHTMHRRNFGKVSGVVLDVCTQHGVFCDAGELDRVRRFVRAGGLELTHAAERRQQADDARVERSREAYRREMATRAGPMDAREHGWGTGGTPAGVTLHALWEAIAGFFSPR